MNMDLISFVDIEQSIPWATYNSDQDGAAIDTRGFEAVAAVVKTGTKTDGTHALEIQQRDDTGDSWTAVPATDLYKDTIPADLAGDSKYRIGIRNPLRYVRVTVNSTGTTGLEYEGHVLLGKAIDLPV